MKLAMILAGAMILAAPAAAHEPGEKQVKKIVMIHQDGAKREIDMDRVHAIKSEHCGDAAHRFESNASEGGQKRKIKLMVCGEGAGNRLAALEKARARLAETDDLGVDPRAKALAALDAEIARLKAEK